MNSSMRDERKSVTALFADVVGSTSMTESLDPEEARDVIGGAITLIIEGVEAFGGTVKDLAGDGALALFGAPITHEDDPERAIRAALRIVADTRGYADGVAARFGLTGFDVRIGIESGLAVLGPVGTGTRVEYGATSDAINTAARLEARAAPGTILVGSSTQRLVAGLFEWEGPVEFEVSGKSAKVFAYQVIRGVKGPASRRRRDALQAPLLGRDPEREIARAQLRKLSRGKGGALFLIGEPGLGKTRMLEEMRREGDGFEWVNGQCLSYGESLPYSPYREMLRDWAEQDGLQDEVGEWHVRDGEMAVISALRSRLATLDHDASADLLPYLLLLMGVKPDAARAAELGQLTPEALQYRTAEAMVEWLTLAARTRPVVAVIEDLHWSDSTSIQLTRRLLTIAASKPVLFVLTFRPERDHPCMELRSDATAALAGAVEEIVLESLPQGADEALLDVLVDSADLPPGLRGAILANAEGNPFFLVEFVRSLVDGGALLPAAAGPSRWRFDHAVPVEVPSSVEKVVQSRIDRLGPSARDSLEAAAVLGRQFQRSALAAVTRLNGALDDALNELVSLDLVRHLDTPGEPEYQFKHALIQETAYNAVLKRRRRELHQLAAQWFETLDAQQVEQMAAVIGDHYRHAGEPERAVWFLELAGDRARRVYAMGEALGAFTAAIEELAGDLTKSEADVQARLAFKRGIVRAQTGDAANAESDFAITLGHAIKTGDQALEMTVQSELGFLLAGAADYRAALPRLERALDLAQALGDAHGQVTALAHLAVVNVSQMLFATALTQSEDALAIARAAGDELMVATALDSLKQGALQLGDWAVELPAAKELEGTLRRQGNLWHLQFVLLEPSFEAAAAGRWEDAFSRVEAARDVNRRIGDRGNAPLYPAAVCRFATATGDYGRALEAGREAVDAAEAVDHAEWIAWSEIHLGCLLQETGDLEGAAGSFVRATEMATRASATFHVVRAKAHLANVYAVRGVPDLAENSLRSVREILNRVELPNDHFWALGVDAYVQASEALLACDRSIEAVAMIEPLVISASKRVLASADAPTYGGLTLARCLFALGDERAAVRQLHKGLRAAKVLRMPGAEWRLHGELIGRCDMPPDRSSSHDHDGARARLLTTLSATIADASMRQAFLEMASSSRGRES